MSLQDISSIVRNEKEDEENKSLLNFYIFDCFDIEAPDVPFNERIEYLRVLIEKYNFKYIKFVPTTIIYSENEGDNIFQTYINNEYEGIVYKNANANYEYSFNKEKRSMYYLKRKVNFTDEYTIIDFINSISFLISYIIFETITIKFINIS
jgi:ATP-dependent DNA ligase